MENGPPIAYRARMLDDTLVPAPIATPPSDPALRRRSGTRGPSRCLVVAERDAAWRGTSTLARRDHDQVDTLRQQPDETLEELFGRAWLRLADGNVRVFALACGDAESPSQRVQLLASIARMSHRLQRSLLVRLHAAVSAAHGIPDWLPETAEVLMRAGANVELRFDSECRTHSPAVAWAP
jgi:hypothetical protein